MEIIAGRLQDLYMDIANRKDGSQSNAMLSRIFALHQRAVNLKGVGEAAVAEGLQRGA